MKERDSSENQQSPPLTGIIDSMMPEQLDRREIVEMERQLQYLYEWSLSPARDTMGAENFDRALEGMQSRYVQLTGKRYIYKEARQK